MSSAACPTALSMTTVCRIFWPGLRPPLPLCPMAPHPGQLRHKYQRRSNRRERQHGFCGVGPFGGAGTGDNTSGGLDSGITGSDGGGPGGAPGGRRKRGRRRRQRLSQTECPTRSRERACRSLGIQWTLDRNRAWDRQRHSRSVDTLDISVRTPKRSSRDRTTTTIRPARLRAASPCRHGDEIDETTSCLSIDRDASAAVALTVI
jgi:hypothetical protein